MGTPRIATEFRGRSATKNHYLKCPLLHPGYRKGNFLFYSISTPQISIWCCVIQCSCSCIIAQQSFFHSLSYQNESKPEMCGPGIGYYLHKTAPSLFTSLQNLFLVPDLQKGVCTYIDLIHIKLFAVLFDSQTHVGTPWHHQRDVCVCVTCAQTIYFPKRCSSILIGNHAKTNVFIAICHSMDYHFGMLVSTATMILGGNIFSFTG